MNDTFKWILTATISMVAIFFVVSALGLDWDYLHSMILSVFETIGILLILFTGSAAAIEVAKYYRAQNRLLKDKQLDQNQTHLDEGDVRALVKQTVEDAILQLDDPPIDRLRSDQKQRASVQPEEAPHERGEKS